MLTFKGEINSEEFTNIQDFVNTIISKEKKHAAFFAKCENVDREGDGLDDINMEA